MTENIWIYDRNENLRLVLNNLPGNYDQLDQQTQSNLITQMAGMYIGAMDVAPAEQTVTEDSGSLPYKNGWVTEQLNGAFKLGFETLGNHPLSERIESDGRAVTRDINGDFVEFIIRIIEDTDDSNGTWKQVQCESAEYELIDEFLPKYVQASVDMQTALTAVLQGTRIEPGRIDNLALGMQPVDLQNMSVKNAAYNLLNIFGAERKFRVELAGNRIIKRYFDALEHRGTNNGKRWEDGKDIISTRRTVDSTTVKTALYGRGASQENDQPRLTFADVEWIKANGDPIDKPLGQTWVGDPDALHKWGYNNGTRHKFGMYDGQEEDPAVLLLNTWNKLQEVTGSNDTYEIKVIQLAEILDIPHEKVRLGDISYAYNKRIHPPVSVETSIIEYRQNLNDRKLSEVTLGKFRSQYDVTSRLNSVEKEVHTNQGNWSKKETPVGAQEKAETEAQQALEDAELQIDEAKQDIQQTQQELEQTKTNLRQAEQDINAAQTDISNAQGNISSLETAVSNKIPIGGAADDINDHNTKVLGKNLVVDGNTTITGTLGASAAVFLDMETRNMTAIDATIDNANITGAIGGKNATFLQGEFRDAYILDANIENATITGTLNSVDGVFTGELYGVNGTFTGDLVGGRIMSGSTINVDTDLYIGNNGYFNAQEYSARFEEKGLYFLDGNVLGSSYDSKITSTNLNLEISNANTVTVDSNNFDVHSTRTSFPFLVELNDVITFKDKGEIYQDDSDGKRLKISAGKTGFWLDPNGTVYFMYNGQATHAFYKNGSVDHYTN